MKCQYLIIIFLIGIISCVSGTTSPSGYYPTLEEGSSLFFNMISMIFIFFSTDPGVWFVALAICLIMLALFKRVFFKQMRKI